MCLCLSELYSGNCECEEGDLNSRIKYTHTMHTLEIESNPGACGYKRGVARPTVGTQIQENQRS